MSSSYKHLDNKTLESLLEKRRKNLAYLEQQAASHGTINVPLYLVNQISEEKQEFVAIEAELSSRIHAKSINKSINSRYSIERRVISSNLTPPTISKSKYKESHRRFYSVITLIVIFILLLFGSHNVFQDKKYNIITFLVVIILYMILSAYIFREKITRLAENIALLINPLYITTIFIVNLIIRIVFVIAVNIIMVFSSERYKYRFNNLQTPYIHEDSPAALIIFAAILLFVIATLTRTFLEPVPPSRSFELRRIQP